jgi:hypothetical protein
MFRVFILRIWNMLRFNKKVHGGIFYFFMENQKNGTPVLLQWKTA